MVSFALGTDTAGSGRVPAATRTRGYRRAFQTAVHRVADIGWTPAEIDYAPLREAAQLLYSGPWVAERLVALTPFIDGHPESVLTCFMPSAHGIFNGRGLPWRHGSPPTSWIER